MEESYAPPSKKLRQRIEQMAKLGGLDSSPVQLGALASLVAVEGSPELLADLPVTRCVPFEEPQCAQALAAVPISSWLNQGCHASVVCLGLSNALHRDQAITAPGAVVTAPSAGLELLLGLQRPSVLREALQSAFHSRPMTDSEGMMQPLGAGASGDLPLAGGALWCCELGAVRPDAARVLGGVGKQGRAHGAAGLEKTAAGACAGTVTGEACGGAGRWRNLLAEVAQEVAVASHQREQHHQHRQRQQHLQHQKQAASLGLKSGEGPRWNSGPRPAAPGGRGAAGALQQQATGAARSHTGNVPDAVAAALPPPAAEEEPLLDADAMAAAAAAVARGAPLVVESFEQACAALHAAFSRSGLWQLRDWAAQGEAEARAATVAPEADGARSSLQQQASEQAAGSEPSESRPGQGELPLLLPAGHGQPPGQRLQSQPSAHLFVRLGYAQHSSRSSSSSAAHSPAAAAASPHYITLDLVFTSLGACCYRGGVGSTGSALPSGLASERLGLGCGCELVAELVARQTDDTGVPQPLQSARRSELCRRLAPLLCANVAPHLMAVLPGEALDAGSPAQGKQHEDATELLRAAVRLITAAETIQTVMVRGDPPPPLPTSTAALRSSAGAGAGATFTSLPTLDPTLLGAQRQLSAHLLANLERTRREAQATREHVYAETCARMADEARLAAEAEARRQAEQEAAARRTAARAAVAAAAAAAAAEAEAVAEAARARLRKAEQRMLEQEAAARQEAVRRAEEEVAAAVAEATRVEAVVAASAAAAHEAQAKAQSAAGSFAAVSAAAAAAVDAVTAAAALPPAALAAAGSAAAGRGAVISAVDFAQPRGYGRVLREQNQSGPQQQPWPHATYLGPQHDQHQPQQPQQATAATSGIFVGGLAKLQKRLEALQRARLAREGGQEGGAGVGTGGGAGHGEACGLGAAASAAATGQGIAALGVSGASSVVGLDLPGQIPAAGWAHVDALAEVRPQALPAGLLCELEPPAAGPQSHELLPASVAAAAAAAAAWDEPPQLRHATPVALHAETQTQPQPKDEAPPVRDAASSAAGSILRGAQSSESSRVRGDGSGGSGQSPSVVSAPGGMWQDTAAERANSQAGANSEFAQSTSRNSNGAQLVLQARSGGMGTQQAASSVSVHGSAVAHSRPHTNSQAAAISQRHGTSSELADDTAATGAAAAASAAATAAAKEAETARLHAVAEARAAAAAAQARSQAQAEAEAAAAAERLSQLRSQFDRLYFGMVPEGLRRGEAPLQQQAELQPERPGLGAQQAAPLEQPRGSDLGGGAAPLESGHLQSNLQLPPRERPAAGPAHHNQLASAGMHLRPVDQFQDGAPTAGLTGARSGRVAVHLLRMPGPTPGLSGALLTGAEVLDRTSTALATLCLAEPASDVADAARPEHCHLNSAGARADASAGKVESLGLAAVCGQQRGHSGGAGRAGRPAAVGDGVADAGTGSYAAQYLQHTSMSAQSRWSASYARQQPSDAAGRCAEAWPQESSVLEFGHAAAAELSQGYGPGAGAIDPEADELAAGADAAAATGRLNDQEGARPHRGAGSWEWGEGGDDSDERGQQPRSEEGWEELAEEPHDPSMSDHDQQGQRQQVLQRQYADEPGHQPAAQDTGGAGDSDGGSHVGGSYEDGGGGSGKGGSDQDTESISLVRRSAHRHSEEDVIERLWPTGGDDDRDGAWGAASHSCSRSLGSRQGRSSEGSRGSARSGGAGGGSQAHSHSRTHTSAAGASASGGSGGGVYDYEDEVTRSGGGGEEAYSHIRSQGNGRSAASGALQSPSTGSSGQEAVAASVTRSRGSRGGGESSQPTAQPQPRASTKSLGTQDTGTTSTALSGGPRFVAASRRALGPDRQQRESRQAEQQHQHLQAQQQHQHLQAQHQHHQHQKQQAEELQRRNAALMGVLERAAAGSDALQAKMYEQRLEVMELQAAMEVERAQHAGEVARLRHQLRHAAEAAVAAEGAAATAAGAAAAAAAAAEGATAEAAAANARAAPTSETEAGKLAIADFSSGMAVGRRARKDPQAAAKAARAAGEAAAEASAAALQALLATYEAHIRDLQKQVESLAAGQSEIAIQAAQQELAGLAAAAASAKRRRRRHSYGGALSQHGRGAAYNIRSGDVSEEGDSDGGGLMPLPSEGQILRGLRGVSAGCGGGGGGGAFGGSIGAVAKWERGRAELKALRLALRQSQQRESGLAAALTAAQQQQRAALLAARQAAGEGARRRWLEQQVSDLRRELEAERGRTSAVLGERDAAHRDRIRLELENQVLLAQQVELRRMCEAYAALAERSNNYMRMAVALPEAVSAAPQQLMLGQLPP